MTHYATLGVSETAGPDEIKRAYRKLASQYHPDKGGDTEKFQEIQTAYDTLADPDRRQRYDHERRNPGAGPGGVHFQWHTGAHPDIGEIFKNFGFSGNPFEHIHNVHRQQQPRRNKDLRVELPIPLVTTLENQTKTISVQTTKGDRYTVDVDVPRGITTGTQIKYANLGDNLFETLARGDLYVQITVHNADGYTADGVDLYHRISVNCLIAMIGGEVPVKGLDGREFLLTVPAGTQPGTKFRINGQGLYQLNSSLRGDLYIEIVITIPQNLTDELKTTVRSLINSL